MEAKVTEIDGVTVMYMNGEKYPFPGFPRGHLLFGKLSKLKHEIKQIFNQSWAKLDNGEKISPDWNGIYELFKDYQYDIIPERKMVPSVRELHRAWTKLAPDSKMKEVVCFILQEDDAYRFRFQWMVPFMGMSRYLSPVNGLERGLEWMEHGEVVGDMKERVRLVRKVMMAILPEHKDFFVKLFREINWSKVKLTKADKYFFRGKYFKVDLDCFEY